MKLFVKNAVHDSFLGLFLGMPSMTVYRDTVDNEYS